MIACESAAAAALTCSGAARVLQIQAFVGIMIDNLIVHNHKLLPLDEASISPGQAGLLLGWGVFTTLRLYRSAPFEFQRHWERMARDAARLRVEMGFEPATVLQSIQDLAHANRREEGMARVSFVRNSGGAWGASGKAGPADLLVFTQPLPPWPLTYRLRTQPNAVFSAGVYAGAKMLSWAANSCIMEQARAEGHDDALLLNERGDIAECTSANIFLVEAGTIFTPPLASGCLSGVTREILLKIGHEAGIPVVEKHLPAESLDQAEEVFISSTTREVGGVREIDGRWKFAAPGEITQAASQAFRQYVESSLNV